MKKIIFILLIVMVLFWLLMLDPLFQWQYYNYGNEIVAMLGTISISIVYAGAILAIVQAINK